MNWLIESLSDWWYGSNDIENQLLNLKTSIKTLQRCVTNCKRMQKTGRSNMLRCFGKQDMAAAEIYARSVVQSLMDEQVYSKMTQSAEKVYSCLMAAYLSGNTNINLSNTLNAFCESTTTQDPITIQQVSWIVVKDQVENRKCKQI